jgi:hypothetical protein
MKIFVLDDSIQRHEHFRNNLDGAKVVPAWTAAQAYPLLRHDRFDAVFLDHDLEMSGDHCGSGTEVVTSIDVLHRMGMYPSAGAVHCVHSANYERAEWMFKVLQAAGLCAKRCTEAWKEERALVALAACGEWTLPERWTDPLIFDEPE